MTLPTQPTDRAELIEWARHRYEMAKDHEDGAWQTGVRGPQLSRLAVIRASWREAARVLSSYSLDAALPLLLAQLQVAETARRRMDGNPGRWAATMVVEAGDELEILDEVVATVEETVRQLGGDA